MQQVYVLMAKQIVVHIIKRLLVITFVFVSNNILTLWIISHLLVFSLYAEFSADLDTPILFGRSTF